MQLSPEQIAKALLNEAFHSRRLVVAMFVVVNAVMLAVGLLWPKTFTASAGILVDERSILQPLMQGAAVATDAMDRSKNAREVMFGRKIMDIILEEGGWLKSTPSAAERDLIIDGIKKRTIISTAGKNILRIEYQDTDPARAFHVTEKLAELFIQESITAKASESRAAFDFIDRQTREYEDKLTRTEQELGRLRSANVEIRVGENELTARLNDLYKRIEAAMQELREAEVKGASLERQVSGEAESTEAILVEGQFRARIADLQSKLDNLRLSYHDTHPDIIQLKEQIQVLTDRISAARTRREQTKRSGRAEPEESAVNNPVYQQLRREQSVNQGTIEALQARIADLQRQLQTEVSRGKHVQTEDVRLAELMRDYQVNRDIYLDLLRRRENARVSMNLDRDQQGLSFKIQEPVRVPQSSSGPRFFVFVLGGMALGLLVPFGLLLARLQGDPRIRVGSAIGVAHRLPIMAVVPHFWTPQELKGLRWELVLLALVIFATVAASAGVAALHVTKVV
jgi:protein tyrosine kinase modulator